MAGILAEAAACRLAAALLLQGRHSIASRRPTERHLSCTAARHSGTDTCRPPGLAPGSALLWYANRGWRTGRGNTGLAATAGPAALDNGSFTGKLLLVDASSIIHRVYHRVHKDYLFPRPGQQSLTSRVALEVAREIGNYVDALQPSHMAVCFDPPGKNWRHAEFEHYKASRPPTAEGIKKAMPEVQTMVKIFGMRALCISGFEADDLIGTLVNRATSEGMAVVLISPDKDMLQLLRPRLTIIRLGAGKEKAPPPEETLDTFRAASGLEPAQWAEALALQGDEADGVPGLQRVGTATATRLLQAFGSIDGLQQNAHKLLGSRTDRPQVRIPKLGASTIGLLQEPGTYRRLKLGLRLTRIPTNVHTWGSGAALRFPLEELRLPPRIPRGQCTAAQQRFALEHLDENADLVARCLGRQLQQQDRGWGVASYSVPSDYGM